jgi:predicted nucleotidyltransferase
MQIDPEWLDALRAWASGTPEVRQVWLFGSRVKGTATPESDLDVALVLWREDYLSSWVLNAARWEAELRRSLPMIDLDCANDASAIVGPAVREHGVCIFERRRRPRGP